MEMNKAEIQEVRDAVAEAAEANVRELNELQLTVVAGGMGEIVFG